MDKLFFYFMALVAVLTIVIVGFGGLGENQPQATTATTLAPTTTTSEPPQTTTTAIGQCGSNTECYREYESCYYQCEDGECVEIQTLAALPEYPDCEKTTTTTSRPAATTTTIPDMLPMNIIKVGRCSQTNYGRLNTIITTLNETTATGIFTLNPEPKAYLSCNGGQPQQAYWLRVKGGMPVSYNTSVAGQFRVVAKCGLREPIPDPRDCETLEAYVGTQGTMLETIGTDEVEYATTTTTTSPPTTTTLKTNPYLDRFRGQGLRKADMHIAWMCPSCVPAVNKLVINTGGVRSRSLSYNQNVSYVVYDPKVITLDEVLMLCNAGGTPTLYRDYELE